MKCEYKHFICTTVDSERYRRAFFGTFKIGTGGGWHVHVRVQACACRTRRSMSAMLKRTWARAAGCLPAGRPGVQGVSPPLPRAHRDTAGQGSERGDAGGLCVQTARVRSAVPSFPSRASLWSMLASFPVPRRTRLQNGTTTVDIRLIPITFSESV